MYNDKKRAVLWAKEHWQIAGVACVFVPVLGFVLVDLGVMSVGGAVAAVIGSIGFVLMTTWDFTHDKDGEKTDAG